MSIVFYYICDGCKKPTEEKKVNTLKKVNKPPNWYERGDEDGDQHACSRECINLIAKETGKTSVVLPI